MADYHRDNASFMIYKDWESLFESLDSNEEAGILIKALFAFAKRGEEAEFTGALKMAFIFMSQQLERDGIKWEETCERRKSGGSKGGRPKSNNLEEPKEPKGYLRLDKNQNKAKEPDTDTVTDTDTETDTVTDIIYEPAEPSPTKQKRFCKPTLEEVTAYCKERNNNIDAQYFVDYYESNGWKVGKNPMKDWKATVRKWEHNNYNTGRTTVNTNGPALTLNEDGDWVDSSGSIYI